MSSRLVSVSLSCACKRDTARCEPTWTVGTLVAITTPGTRGRGIGGHASENVTLHDEYIFYELGLDTELSHTAACTQRTRPHVAHVHIVSSNVHAVASSMCFVIGARPWNFSYGDCVCCAFMGQLCMSVTSRAT